MTIDLSLLFGQALPYYEITFYSIILSGESHSPSCSLKKIMLDSIKYYTSSCLGFLKKYNLGGTEEVTYQVKFLACKHRYLNLDSQYHIKLGMVHTPGALALGVEERAETKR